MGKVADVAHDVGVKIRLVTAGPQIVGQCPNTGERSFAYIGIHLVDILRAAHPDAPHEVLGGGTEWLGCGPIYLGAGKAEHLDNPGTACKRLGDGRHKVEGLRPRKPKRPLVIGGVNDLFDVGGEALGLSVFLR